MEIRSQKDSHKTPQTDPKSVKSVPKTSPKMRFHNLIKKCYFWTPWNIENSAPAAARVTFSLLARIPEKSKNGTKINA